MSSEETVKFDVIKEPDPNEDRVEYIVQRWGKPELVFAMGDTSKWLQYGYSRDNEPDALKSALVAKETYAKVRVIRRTTINDVIA